MPKIALQLKAELENVTNLKPEGEDFRWFMKLKCESCGEETPEFIYCTLTESLPLKGGRGHASLVLKCKLCKRENSIDIIKESLAPYNAEDAGKYKTLVKFDCRGVSPTDFDLRAGWTAEGTESSTPFIVNLTDKEWYDYDEKAGESVSIIEISSQCISVKQ
ncbi:UPF0587 protein v1g245604-like [Babylonia areolata]|uniref:UPF0587 protein v1g245604-like n=1 Tax=Babylonia areolata TaxID=304850 RepID=UPI003FD340F8